MARYHADGGSIVRDPSPGCGGDQWTRSGGRSRARAGL
jgi:hypothetical protein